MLMDSIYLLGPEEVEKGGWGVGSMWFQFNMEACVQRFECCIFSVMTPSKNLHGEEKSLTSCKFHIRTFLFCVIQ